MEFKSLTWQNLSKSNTVNSKPSEIYLVIFTLGVVHKWRQAILNIFDLLTPYRHPFYYLSISIVVTKWLTPLSCKAMTLF